MRATSPLIMEKSHHQSPLWSTGYFFSREREEKVVKEHVIRQKVAKRKIRRDRKWPKKTLYFLHHCAPYILEIESFGSKDEKVPVFSPLYEVNKQRRPKKIPTAVYGADLLLDDIKKNINFFCEYHDSRYQSRNRKIRFIRSIFIQRRTLGSMWRPDRLLQCCDMALI